MFCFLDIITQQKAAHEAVPASVYAAHRACGSSDYLGLGVAFSRQGPVARSAKIQIHEIEAQPAAAHSQTAYCMQRFHRPAGMTA